MKRRNFAEIEENGQYYEGILQLRGPSDEVIAFIISQVKAAKGVFISKELKAGNGLDLYFSSARFLLGLGKKLQARFGGELKTSRKIHTRDKQKSRDVYRVSVLYVTPRIMKGDVAMVGNSLLHVSSVGRMVHGTDLKTGRRIALRCEPGSFEVLEKRKSRVMKIFPSLEVMHPDTFQPIAVRNFGGKTGGGKKEFRQGENVEIVLMDGAWVVP